MKHVHVVVRFIKDGTSRLIAFKKPVELENLETNAFLKLDGCTRWNSTYLEKVFLDTRDKIQHIQ